MVLIGVIFFQRSCTSKNPILDDPNIVVINKKHYEYLKSSRDTIYITETFYYKGDPIPGKEIYVPIPTDIDTPAIIRSYFTKRPYSEIVNIVNGEKNFGTVTVTDTVFKNRLYGRKYDFDLIIPEYQTTIVVKELPKRQLFLGGGLNFDNTHIINSIYGGLLYKDRKEHIYGLNLGISTHFDQSITPYVGGSMYWKISLKKKRPIYHEVSKQSAQFILDNM